MSAFQLTFMSCLLKYTFKIPLINFRAIKMSAFELSHCQLKFNVATSDCCCITKASNMRSCVCALPSLYVQLHLSGFFPLITHSHNQILLLWAAGMLLYIFGWHWHWLTLLFRSLQNNEDFYWFIFVLNKNWKHNVCRICQVRNINWNNCFFRAWI